MSGNIQEAVFTEVFEREKCFCLFMDREIVSDGPNIPLKYKLSPVNGNRVISFIHATKLK